MFTQHTSLAEKQEMSFVPISFLSIEYVLWKSPLAELSFPPSCGLWVNKQQEEEAKKKMKLHGNDDDIPDNFFLRRRLFGNRRRREMMFFFFFPFSLLIA